MKASEFDGRTVLFIDSLKLVHSGTVVGQSLDGNWILVQSDDPDVPAADWHFRVTRKLIDAVLMPA